MVLAATAASSVSGDGILRSSPKWFSGNQNEWKSSCSANAPCSARDAALPNRQGVTAMSRGIKVALRSDHECDGHHDRGRNRAVDTKENS